MGHVRRLHDPDPLELDPAGAGTLEQPSAGTEEHGHEVDLELVDEARREVLLRDVRAHQADVPVIGRCARLAKRAVDAGVAWPGGRF